MTNPGESTSNLATVSKSLYHLHSNITTSVTEAELLITQNMSITSWLLLTPLSTPWKCAFLVLAIFIAATNFFIIVVFCASRRTRKQMGLFLLNLAIVDLQNGLLSIPFLVFYPRSDLADPEDISAATCVLLVTWPQTLYTVAYHSVCLVTIERFISITKPFLYNKILQHRKAAVVVGFMLWVCDIFISIIPVFNQKLPSDEAHMTLCNNSYKAGVVYIQLFIVTVILLPLVINLVLYMIMYKLAKKHLTSMKKLQVPSSEPNNSSSSNLFSQKPTRLSSSSLILGYFKRVLQSSLKRRQVIKASKAAKTTCVLTIFYISSWLPFILLVQVYSLCKADYCMTGVSKPALQAALPYAMFLAFLSSAVNPVIYILRNKTVKREIRMLFMCGRSSASQRWSVCSVQGIKQSHSVDFKSGNHLNRFLHSMPHPATV